MPKAMSKVSKGKKQGGKPKKQSTGGKGAAAKKSTRKASALAKKAAPKPRSAGKAPARRTAAKKGAKAMKAAKTRGAKLSTKPAPGAKPAAVKVRSAAPGRNKDLPTTVGPRPFAPPPAVEGTGEPSGTNGVGATGNLPIERGGGGGADTGPM